MRAGATRADPAPTAPREASLFEGGALELRLGAHALSTLYRDRVMAPDAMVRGGVGLILG